MSSVSHSALPGRGSSASGVGAGSHPHTWGLKGVWAASTGWLAFGVLAVAAAWQLSPRGDIELVTYAGAACWAIVMGTGLWAQYSILRNVATARGKPLSARWWQWLAVSLGGLLAMQIAVMWGLSSPLLVAALSGFGEVNLIYFLFAFSVVVVSGASIGAVAGLAVGAAQWSVLKKDLPESGWAGRSSLGWAMAGAAYSALILLIALYGSRTPAWLAVAVAAALPCALVVAWWGASALGRGLRGAAGHAEADATPIAPSPRVSGLPLFSVGLGLVGVALVISVAAVSRQTARDYALAHPAPQITPYHMLAVGQMYEPVNLAFSPDGSMMAAATEDRRIDLLSRPHDVRVWRTSDKSLLYTLHIEVNPGPLSSLAFSPDGTLLATGFRDRMEIRRAQDGSVHRTMTGEHIGDNAVFSPDWRYFLSDNRGTMLGAPRLWDTDSGQPVALAGGPGSDEVIYGAAFSPDGRSLTVAYWQKLLAWSLPDGAETKRLALEADDPWWTTLLGGGKGAWHTGGVAFARDGKTMALSSGAEVRLLEIPSYRTLRTFDLKVTYLRGEAMAFSPDGTLLAVNMGNDRVRVLQVADGVVMADLVTQEQSRGAQDGVYYYVDLNMITFTPDGREVVASTGDNWNTGDQTGELRFWRLPGSP